jgi:hypothetical protein
MPSAPTVLDIEASGFGRHSYPIEVGLAMADGSSFCCLIRPEPEWTHWDPAAESIHRIRRDTALAHGRPAHEVARVLNSMLRGQTVYSDGWAHDYSWMSALFEVAEMAPAFKLESLRTLLSESQAERWHDVKRQVSAQLSAPRHRASADARLLQHTLIQLLDERIPTMTGTC